MTCRPASALSVTVIVPVVSPNWVGVNVALMVQFAPGAKVAGEMGQLFVWEKSPPATMVSTVKGALPGLLSKKVLAGLVVPVNSGANVNWFG